MVGLAACPDPKLLRTQSRYSSALKPASSRLSNTGKTHMAEALCALACQRARPARLLAASSLVMRLRRARDDGRPGRELAQLGGAELLVIDELGFLPLDADGARLLFQVTTRWRRP